MFTIVNQYEEDGYIHECPFSESYLKSELLFLASLSHVTNKAYSLSAVGITACVSAKYYEKRRLGWKNIDRIPAPYSRPTTHGDSELGSIHSILEKYGFTVTDEVSMDTREHQLDPEYFKNIYKSELVYRKISGRLELTPSYIQKMFPEHIAIINRLKNIHAMDNITGRIIEIIKGNPVAYQNAYIELDEDTYNYAHELMIIIKRKKFDTDAQKYQKYLKFSEFGMNPPTDDVIDTFRGVMIGTIENTTGWEYDDYNFHIPYVEKKTYKDW